MVLASVLKETNFQLHIIILNAKTIDNIDTYVSILSMLKRTCNGRKLVNCFTHNVGKVGSCCFKKAAD